MSKLSLVALLEKSRTLIITLKWFYLTQRSMHVHWGWGGEEREEKWTCVFYQSVSRELLSLNFVLASPLQFPLRMGIKHFHIKFILCLVGQLLKCKEKLCFSGVEECLLLMEKVFFSFWQFRPQSQIPDPYLRNM